MSPARTTTEAATARPRRTPAAKQAANKKTATKKVAKKAATKAATKVAKNAAKNAAKKVSKNAANRAAKKVAKEVAKKAAEKTAKTVAKKATKNVAKKVATKQSATKQSAKKAATKKTAATRAPTTRAAAKKAAATKRVAKQPARAAKTAPQATAKPAKPKPVKASARGPIFTPALVQFLGELALHNDRDWFAANKRRYEEHVREPALELIRALAPRLARYAPSLVASDRKVGGSLMRVHRDTRFSPDKTPYKTNVGIQFRHGAGKDVHAPGLYIHVEPGEVFLGAGLWRPDKDPLAAIRTAITDDPKAWCRVRDDKAFTERWSLAGESLKRPPRGVDPSHPALEDLKRKDHIATSPLPVSALMGPDVVDVLMERFQSARPYFAYLVKALDLTM